MKAYERFLKYAAFPTMSTGASATVPSTKKQLALSAYIAEELKALGLSDAHVDGYGYVYATLPKNTDGDINTIGLIAHVDTSPDAPDENVKARVYEYSGGDITLNAEKNIVMRVSDYPNLEKYKGHHLIVSDGTTLIGADDKAGVAEIITAVERLITSNAPHGTVKIAFTPDEEIGRGADKFDVKGFDADYAYTVDGGALGEIEFENFNAAGARITVHGVSIHPGSAKGKMKNAALIATEFNALLPENEIPSMTENYEGFHHLSKIEGSIEHATLSYIIRDHDREKFEEKKKFFLTVADKLNKKYGDGTVEISITDTYYNMREVIEKHMYTVERAERAMTDVGVTPNIIPIRGGTDGARLSFMGLPCPNLCTGGENFHSRFEFISVEAMDKITDILVKIIENAVTDGKAK